MMKYIGKITNPSYVKCTCIHIVLYFRIYTRDGTTQGYRRERLRYLGKYFGTPAPSINR